MADKQLEKVCFKPFDNKQIDQYYSKIMHSTGQNQVPSDVVRGSLYMFKMYTVTLGAFPNLGAFC